MLKIFLILPFFLIISCSTITQKCSDLNIDSREHCIKNGKIYGYYQGKYIPMVDILKIQSENYTKGLR